MPITFQTNYASLVAANNLNVISANQTKTIQQLTSGFRINSSADDAAGLAVSNSYNSSIAELTQGVLNGNQGVSQLQIVDGGLSNITTILNRLKTLAAESASATFAGDRTNINTEFQALLTQVTQQASNIGLNNGGKLNILNQVFIGGGSTNANSQVAVDLAGASNQVDAVGLGISNTSVVGGGTELTDGTPNALRLDTPGVLYLAGSFTQTFAFQTIFNNAAIAVNATVTGTAGGLTADQVVGQLNGTLQAYGITSQVGSDGQINFGGATAFQVVTGAIGGGVGVATAASAAVNTGNYNISGATYAAPASAEILSFQNGIDSTTVSIAASTTVANAIIAINAALNTGGKSLGIYATKNAAGDGITLQSASSFTVSSDTANKVFGGSHAIGAQTVTAPGVTANITSNAISAITSINDALAKLGQVQSRVGAGENKLAYAISLANSQIVNYSAALSGIRDTDVAAAAAALTKGQVLQQASVAALAQANSAPQSLLKLFQ